MGKKASGNAPTYGGNQAAAGQQPITAGGAPPQQPTPNKSGGGKKSTGAPNSYQPQQPPQGMIDGFNRWQEQNPNGPQMIKSYRWGEDPNHEAIAAKHQQMPYMVNGQPQQPAQQPVQEPVQEPVAQPVQEPAQEAAQQPRKTRLDLERERIAAGQTVNENGQPIRPDGGGGSSYTPPPSADSQWVPNDQDWKQSGGSWQQGASSDPKMAAQVQRQFDKANPQAQQPPQGQSQGQEQQQGWQNQAMDWLRNGGQQEVMAWLRQQGGGYSNNNYGTPRDPYQGGGYAPLPGNDSAILGEGETQGNPFLNNRNFEQTNYSYNDGRYRTPYGTTLQNPGNYANMGKL